MLAERTCVDVRAGNKSEDGVEKLERVFARLLSRHEEGAVVKAEEGVYGAPWGLSRWVKVSSSNFFGTLVLMAHACVAQGGLYPWVLYVNHKLRQQIYG